MCQLTNECVRRVAGFILDSYVKNFPVLFTISQFPCFLIFIFRLLYFHFFFQRKVYRIGDGGGGRDCATLLLLSKIPVPRVHLSRSMAQIPINWETWGKKRTKKNG